jgi:hypothetical protein
LYHGAIRAADIFSIPRAVHRGLSDAREGLLSDSQLKKGFFEMGLSCSPIKFKIKIKLLGSECQASGAYAKRAKQAKKWQRRGLLVFSELPSLPSAGSRLGCFHTALSYKLRSLIQVSKGWFDFFEK